MIRKLLPIILLLIVVIFSMASYSQVNLSGEEENLIIIPLDISTHRPIVEVTIDGKGPYKFIFDTGSTTNVIDESLNIEFGFEIVGEDPLQTPGSDNKLVSQRVNVPQVGLPSTNISKDVEMNVIALRALLPVDGILGGYFLEEYLVTLDYPASNLILTIGKLNKNDKEVTSFIQDARSINLNIDVNGNIVEAHLDTGNPHSITLPYALKDKLTFKEVPKKGSAMRTPVATFDSYEAELVGSISIGNAVFENPQIRLADGFTFANLGYEVIKNLRTTIDRKNNLIKFEKVAQVNSINESTKETGTSTSQSSPYTGNYEGDRKIWVDESGNLQYQRTGSPMALKLTLIEEDLYEMKVPESVRAPNGIPNVFFIKNENQEVSGIELVYNDGRKEGPFKKVAD